jgi:hypothetical protein
MDSEIIKEAAKSIYYFDFPAGILILMGCFVFGAGVITGDISLLNKRLLLGVFIFSLGPVCGEFRHFLTMLWRSRFRDWRFGNLLVAALFSYVCYWSARILWPLVQN